MSVPNILVPGLTLESMVMASGGAWIPPDGSGEFNVLAWAGFVQRTDSTVREYLRKNSVEVRVIGDQQFIAPEAFREAFPLVKSNAIERPGRGGNRRKKTGDA